MKLRFDRFDMPSYWTNYERHKDLKQVAAEHYALCIDCMARTLSTYGFCEGLRDNEDLFYFPYLRAVNAWLFSDRNKSLSSYVTSAFHYFICECARQSNTRKRRKELDAYPVSLDFRVGEIDGTIADVIADPRQDIEKKVELEEAHAALLKRIDEHEAMGAKSFYKRKWTTVSYWTVFKMWISEKMSIDDLYARCIENGYVEEACTKKDLRKILYYCRCILKEDMKNGKLSTAD